jgi:hypothetical protein
MSRSYAKESKKSKPVGIRYNLEEFSVAIKKSGKKTAQALFDFLLTNYVYSGAQQTATDLTTINTEPIKFKQPAKDFKYYSRLIPDLTFENEYREFVEEVQASPTLTQKEKETLILALKNK